MRRFSQDRLVTAPEDSCVPPVSSFFDKKRRPATPHAVGRFVMSIFPSFSEEMVHMMRPPHRPIDFIAEHSRRRRWVLRIGARTYRITRTVWIRLIIHARHWF